MIVQFVSYSVWMMRKLEECEGKIVMTHFLTHQAPNHHRTSDDTVLEDDVRRLDERKFAKEMEWVHGDPYYPLNMPVRVYVYKMPTKFTYDLLWLFRNTYRDTFNLTSNGSPVHRLIEQGGEIRSKLVAELTGANDMVLEEGTSGEGRRAAAQKGMRRSIFCLSPAGDTPSSARLFDAIVSGCIPVIISDELELPFEGILDYRKIAIFVSSTDAVQPGWLLRFLKGISSTQIRELRKNLSEMAGKLVNIKLHTRRSQRVVKESRSVCTCDCRRGNITGSNPFF